MSGLYCLILGLVGGFDAWLTVCVVLRTTLLLVAAAYYVNVFGTIILITKSCHHFVEQIKTNHSTTYQHINKLAITYTSNKHQLFCVIIPHCVDMTLGFNRRINTL